jgi:hypothetical protein
MEGVAPYSTYPTKPEHRSIPPNFLHYSNPSSSENHHHKTLGANNIFNLYFIVNDVTNLHWAKLQTFCL